MNQGLTRRLAGQTLDVNNDVRLTPFQSLLFLFLGCTRIAFLGRARIALLGRARIALLGRARIALLGRTRIAFLGRTRIALLFFMVRSNEDNIAIGVLGLGRRQRNKGSRGCERGKA